MSGSELAGSYGYDPGEYGDYFTPMNMDSINKGMSEIPQMQDFLRGNVRNDYTNRKNTLLDKVGQSGFASTGSFDNQFNQTNQQFSKDMFNADKQVQDIVQGYQDTITQGVGQWGTEARGLMQSGAEKADYVPYESDFSQMYGHGLGNYWDKSWGKDGLGGAIGDAWDNTIGVNGLAGWVDDKTVLCTELNRQGVMSDELYIKESQATKNIPENVKDGYRLWAIPLVNKMKKSKKLTKFLTPFIMSFANHLAGNKNILGKVLLSIGLPICSVINSVHKLFVKSSMEVSYGI